MNSSHAIMIPESRPLYTVSTETGKWQVMGDELRKMKLMIGTPMQDCKCTQFFHQSMKPLVVEFFNNHMPMSHDTMGNESGINRARNTIVAEFLASDYTHMMFIDGDIKFDSDDVIKMMAMNLNVVGASYPKKGVNWQRAMASAHMAFQTNSPFSPSDLQSSGLESVCHPIADREPDHCNGATEVSRLGTGFMLIKREVFQRMIDEQRVDKLENIDARLRLFYYTFFVDTWATGEYLSEDYQFCETWKQMGGRCWCLAEAKLGHAGTILLEGNGL